MTHIPATIPHHPVYNLTTSYYSIFSFFPWIKSWDPPWGSSLKYSAKGYREESWTDLIPFQPNNWNARCCFVRLQTGVMGRNNTCFIVVYPSNLSPAHGAKMSKERSRRSQRCICLSEEKHQDMPWHKVCIFVPAILLGQLQNYILLLVPKFKTDMPKFPNSSAFLALQQRSKGIEI